MKNAIWAVLFLMCLEGKAEKPIRAVYLSAETMGIEKVTAGIETILATTDANAVVIDFKIGRVVPEKHLRSLIARFRAHNAYLIARIVVMQDSYLARTHPGLALHKKDGTLWFSGDASWQRYWVDPASPEVVRYNIDIAKRAIDIGFDEINFDYIRFPTDGTMNDIIYPIFDARIRSKRDVMNDFFRDIRTSLKTYRPDIVLSIDLFGQVAAHNGGKEIGQELESCATYFDVLCPMVYPSHYRCGEFGFTDPTAHPYEVCSRTLVPAKEFLESHNLHATLRPWFQAFSISGIYRCGPFFPYGVKEVRAEIRSGTDAGVPSFILWNAGSRFSSDYFEKK